MHKCGGDTGWNQTKTKLQVFEESGKELKHPGPDVPRSGREGKCPEVSWTVCADLSPTQEIPWLGAGGREPERFPLPSAVLRTEPGLLTGLMDKPGTCVLLAWTDSHINITFPLFNNVSATLAFFQFLLFGKLSGEFSLDEILPLFFLAHSYTSFRCYFLRDLPWQSLYALSHPASELDTAFSSVPTHTTQ